MTSFRCGSPRGVWQPSGRSSSLTASSSLTSPGTSFPEGETFSMGVLALRNSQGRNAVSELHGRVSRRMWNFLWPDRTEDQVPITHVTNGVHTANWMARRLRLLLRSAPGTRIGRTAWMNPNCGQGLDAIPDDQLWAIRTHLKRRLAFYMRERVRGRWTEGGYHPVQVVASGVLINPYALTIGFARRFATYKRADLVLSDIERLLAIVNRANRPVQIIFAGKAHPADEAGKLLLQDVYRDVKRAEASGRLVFLEDYDINLARYLVQGVDVWLNTPRRPLEASGTSGMKAALNGALNFSVLDGWWREAYNGRNGWAIGADVDPESSEAQDARRCGQPVQYPGGRDRPAVLRTRSKGDLPLLDRPHEGIHEDHHPALQHPPDGQGIRRASVRARPELSMFEFLFSPVAWLNAALIFALRITDMSIDTLRVLFVVRGQKRVAWILGFFQSAIFVIAITRVLADLDNPLVVLGYAAGFATGNVLGIMIEERLAVGHIQLQIVSRRRGAAVARALRQSGYGVTEISARGRDGTVKLLTASVHRKDASRARQIVHRVDEDAFITSEDVRPVRRGFLARLRFRRGNRRTASCHPSRRSAWRRLRISSALRTLSFSWMCASLGNWRAPRIRDPRLCAAPMSLLAEKGLHGLPRRSKPGMPRCLSSATTGSGALR